MFEVVSLVAMGNEEEHKVARDLPMLEYNFYP
jgi:hypothetical protein